MDQDSTEHVIRLLSTHQEQIFRYVFALLPHEQDAKDVVQETSVALCRKFEEYDRDKPFLPWAFRFAYIEVIRYRQKRQRGSVSLSNDVIELLAKQRDDQRELLDARLAALEECLRVLPPNDRKLVQGRYHARLPIDELAKQVAMSQRTLFRNLDRIRRRLYECINRHLDSEAIR